jgi:16S rRNA (adenine1518-N6/adenine1519-N6)-dimethyltransferase
LNLEALASKHRIDPAVLFNVQAGLAIAEDRRFKMVANLPYNIATPLISNLLIHETMCPILMVVTIQLELAERMMAEPATSSYSALSVLIQALADVEIVRVLSPKVFWPPPKVESAIVKITPRIDKREAIKDLVWFHAMVRRIFVHRRKNLRQVLHGMYKKQATKPEIDTLLESLGLTGQIRAETMNVEEFILLADTLQARFGPEPSDNESESESEIDNNAEMDNESESEIDEEEFEDEEE